MLAHSRRQRENDTFLDIAESLPIQENAKDLDKASILRVAIHYLKLRDMMNDGNPEAASDAADGTMEENGALYLRPRLHVVTTPPVHEDKLQVHECLHYWCMFTSVFALRDVVAFV